MNEPEKCQLCGKEPEWDETGISCSSIECKMAEISSLYPDDWNTLARAIAATRRTPLPATARVVERLRHDIGTADMMADWCKEDDGVSSVVVLATHGAKSVRIIQVDEQSLRAFLAEWPEEPKS